MAGAKVGQFDAEQMQSIVRIYNTNIDGTKKAPFAFTKIRGIGKRFAKAVVLRAGISVNKMAGELTHEEIEKIQEVIADPVAFGIPAYMLNHQKDFADGLDSQFVGVKLDADLRMRIERGKRIREIKALRLDAGLKVRGQRTKSNGRKGKNMKTNKKK
ncbi:small subunit ribosomal protein S18e [Pancytospora philotis]|nr:small subunit ribosomal protein S18e [Pancytospora philotis]